MYGYLLFKCNVFQYLDFAPQVGLLGEVKIGVKMGSSYNTQNYSEDRIQGIKRGK